MKNILTVSLSIVVFSLNLFAQSPDASELTHLLNEFLAGAGRNDAVVHDRFWADDLIYTRGAGQRVGKAEIMKSVREAPPAKPDDPKTVYTAEDVRIQQYGSTAVVAFRLVGTTENTGKTTVAKFLNTGTFVKRKGKWQAVAWQATKIPNSEEDSRKQVAAVEEEFRRAVSAADMKKLEELLHPSFVWVHSTGERTDRGQFIEKYGSGKLKYSKFETNDVSVSVYGDTAIVRGISPRQLTAESAAATGASSDPFVLHYTMTFVNFNGTWRPVAAHSSRSAK